MIVKRRKMKKKNKLILPILLAIASYVIWRGMINYAVAGIGAYGNELKQDFSGQMICAVGDRTTILPVINVFDTSDDGRSIDSGVGKALRCLAKRYNLNKDMYVSKIVEIINSPETSDYCRVHLIEVLEMETGERFGFVYEGSPEKGKDAGIKKKNIRALKRINEWWSEHKNRTE